MRSPYNDRTTEDLLSEFVREFKRIKKCSQRRYNKYRSSSVPEWGCVARRIGVTRWSDVCRAAGVIPTIQHEGITMTVESYSVTEEKIKEIERKYSAILEDIRRNNC